MITGKSLFEQYRLECGMDDDDVKAARWYKDGLIDFADWILSQHDGKPIVSGSLPPVAHPDTYVWFLLWLYNKGLITDYDFDFEKVSKRYVRSLSRRQISR